MSVVLEADVGAETWHKYMWNWCRTAGVKQTKRPFKTPTGEHPFHDSQLFSRCSKRKPAPMSPTGVLGGFFGARGDSALDERVELGRLS